MSTHLPEAPERRADAQGPLRVTMGNRPIDGCAEVVVVELEAIEPLLLLGPKEMRRRAFSEQLHCHRVAVANLILLPARLEHLERVLAYDLEHEEPRLVVVRQAPQQALVGELVETRQHVATDLGG